MSPCSHFVVNSAAVEGERFQIRSTGGSPVILTPVILSERHTGEPPVLRFEAHPGTRRQIPVNAYLASVSTVQSSAPLAAS